MSAIFCKKKKKSKLLADRRSFSYKAFLERTVKTSSPRHNSSEKLCEPADKVLQPIRGQGRGSTPISFQPGEGAGPDSSGLVNGKCYIFAQNN